MRKNLPRMLALVLVLLVAASGNVWGAVTTGQIKSISKKAKTIQIQDGKTKKTLVITIGNQTRFLNAKSLSDFIINDKVTVEYESDQPARRIERKLSKVPKERLIDTRGMAALMRSGKPFTVVDSRPAARYEEGHIVGAISVPVSKMKQSWRQLPKDKNRLLVFYCGGPT